MKVYQKGEAQTEDEIIVEFDFMWSGQQVILIMFVAVLHAVAGPSIIHVGLLLDMTGL